jgi:hypothetical protein
MTSRSKPLNGYRFSRLGRKLGIWFRGKKFTRSEEIKACLEYVVAQSVAGGVDSEKILELMGWLETRMTPTKVVAPADGETATKDTVSDSPPSST